MKSRLPFDFDKPEVPGGWMKQEQAFSVIHELHSLIEGMNRFLRQD
jgi:hypothetical protein